MKEWNGERQNIFLFKRGDSEHSHCHLRCFINFLVSREVPRPINFSYVGAEGGQLNNLSLRQNICLDSIPHSLGKRGELHLRQHLLVRGGRYLLELHEQIALLDEPPSRVDDQSRKLAALLRGLLKKARYLLLESPEKHLSVENGQRFLAALRFIQNKYRMTVLLSSHNLDFWDGRAGQEVLCGGGKGLVEVRSLPRGRKLVA